MAAREAVAREVRRVRLADLRPAEWNANRVPPGVLRKIRRSIEEFGFVENLVARPHPDGPAGTLEVLSGNHRLGLLEEMAFQEVPVVVVDVDDAHARILAQALNRTRGEDDPEAYGRLLEQVLASVDAARVAEFLPETETSIDRAIARIRPAVSEDEAPPVPTDPESQPGEVYELGAHRLVCGDATNSEHVRLALDGEELTCVVTDPPYGVDYAAKTAFLTGGEGRRMENDDLDAFELEQLLQDAFAVAAGQAIPGAPIYVWYSHAQEVAFKSAFAGGGWRYAQTLVWVKNHMVLGRQDYQWKHEPILYGWKPGAAHRWFGDHSEVTTLDDDLDLRALSKPELIRLLEHQRTRENTDVLRADRPTSSELHPTQKPVWLLEHFLWNSTERGGIVLDPFAGSGSTLVAAERTGRRCCAIEIDPGYCDVIRRRYERLLVAV